MLLNPLLPESSSAAAGASPAGGGAAAELRTEPVGAEYREKNGEKNGENELKNPSEASRKWGHEETLALLKVRSQMNNAFLQATHKSTLWDEVSRKMGEMGYHRSGKKCKEKFENIYKYNRRSKKVQSGRENGKNYRFFELLEIFNNQASEPADSTNEIQTLMAVAEAEMAIPLTSGTSKDTCASQDSAEPFLAQEGDLEFMSTSTSSKSSSERHSEGSIGKKRRITNYIEKLVNGLLEKQQDLHNKFLETIENYEKARLAREEAWKIQEMARIKQEQAVIDQERALVAAKDAALISFLQKLSAQEIHVPLTTMAPLSGRQEIQVPFTPLVPLSGKQEDYGKLFVRSEENYVNLPNIGISRQVNVTENYTHGSSSRWPKEEVEALVRLRSNFDFHENGNKGGLGPLWEEISSEMNKLGYNRSSKKCKEKWENMNKYYRRVKDANKKRPEDSKTCPYYNLLESLYENRSKRLEHNSCSDSNMKPEHILMQMMTQEQGKLQEPQQPVEEHGETHIHRYQDDNEDGYHSGY